ncbi:MAG: hypothetical protein ACK5IQ_11670 [Bacteroidales bacterium]
MTDYFLLALMTFALGIPFGYLRAGVKKLSFWWFVYIHLPIPFIILFRKYLGIPIYYSIIVTLPTYFLAHYLGMKLRQRKSNK